MWIPPKKHISGNATYRELTFECSKLVENTSVSRARFRLIGTNKLGEQTMVSTPPLAADSRNVNGVYRFDPGGIWMGSIAGGIGFGFATAQGFAAAGAAVALIDP
jgi:hypothetical protein